MSHHTGHSLNRIAFSATTHCLTGCTIGEVLGMVIGNAYGWSNFSTIVLAVALAFVFGYALTVVPLLRTGMALIAVLSLAFAADTVSITVMEIVDNLVMLLIPGAMDATLLQAQFWSSLALSLVLAGVVAFPVNRWLIARGKATLSSTKRYPIIIELAMHHWPHKIILAVVAIHVVAAFIFFGAYFTPTSAKSAAVYCSSDGVLSNTKPMQSHRSYCIKSNPQTFAANKAAPFAFSIVDDQGATLKDFGITHTKPMHVIVVRKDLSSFQHLHPTYDPQTGTFSIANLTLPDEGEYRVFADFAVGKGAPLPVTIFKDIKAGSTFVQKPLGDEARSKRFGPYQVSLAQSGGIRSGVDSMLTFNLFENGNPVTDLETYLGALGHTVVLREGSLEFIHAHPMEEPTSKQNGAVRFMVNFPQPGKYKVFSQFQRAGKLVLTEFVVTAQASSEPSSTAPKEHSMH